MRLENLWKNGLDLTAFAMGQISIWWGLMVAIGYNFAFAVLLSHNRIDRADGPFETLPVLLPLIGLGFGGVAALAARLGGERGKYALIGLILNAIPFAMALALWAL